VVLLYSLVAIFFIAFQPPLRAEVVLNTWDKVKLRASGGAGAAVIQTEQ